MQELQYGLRDGILISVQDQSVASGLSCGCTCPSCGARLIARKGNVRKHHFDFICETCNKVNTQLAALCEQNIAELNEEIEEALSSDAAVYFFNSVSESYSEKRHFFNNREKRLNKVKFEAVKNVVEPIAGKALKAAVKDGAAAKGFLINAKDAAGSPLHLAVKNIGKNLGVKFKPWQAVKIAKNIGNVAKCLGPAMVAFGAFLDAKEMIDEEKRAKEIEKAKVEFREEFNQIRSDLERQYVEELQGMYDVYDDITRKLQEGRDSVQNSIAADNELLGQLAVIRKNLVSIQGEIFD